MAVDWTKYPPLPPAPEFPEWRDTPEREAYWRDWEAMPSAANIDCRGVLVWGGLVSEGFFLLLVFVPTLRREWPMAALFAFFVSGPAMVVYCVVNSLLSSWRLNRKYGGYPGKLRRPDLSDAVAAIMAARPYFDEAQFRKYWPAERHVDMALKILGWVRETWAIPDKMLYPNDSLMLFYEYKLTGDVEDYEDNFFELIPPGASFDYDNTFAELVEIGLANSKK